MGSGGLESGGLLSWVASLGVVVSLAGLGAWGLVTGGLRLPIWDLKDYRLVWEARIWRLQSWTSAYNLGGTRWESGVWAP